MFKNLTIYRIAPGWNPALDVVDAALEAGSFAPCGATQEKSVGWVPPRGEAHDAFVESVGGQRLLKLMIQTKSVPGSLVREKADEAATEIEDTTGRKPGKKQMKELREDALLTLLPQAFPRTASVLVWIDQATGLLITDAVAQSKLDEVVTALVRTFDDLALRLVQTKVAPSTAMTTWLTQDANDWPDGIHVERECELKSVDEEKSVVKFNRHDLPTDDIRKHITEGKLPTRLALSYDGRVSFVLTEAMQLKKIKFLDVPEADSDADAFDADVALSTGELQRLIPALIGALGGEIKQADPLFGE